MLKTSKEIDIILDKISKIYPDAKTELNYSTDFQFFIAVVLSAQNTDKQVNKVTERLFKIIKEPKDILWISQLEMEKFVWSINYYKHKAKFIRLSGEKLYQEFDSQIPDDLAKLITLPWVGIKTAKVLLSVLYDKPFVAVDTHVHRVCNRIWIVTTKAPEETDKKLEKILNYKQKMKMHHITVLFGRYICQAKKPLCENCSIKDLCNYNVQKGKSL